MAPQQAHLADAGHPAPQHSHPSDLHASGVLLESLRGTGLFLLVFAVAVAAAHFLVWIRLASRSSRPPIDIDPRTLPGSVALAVAVTVATWLVARSERRSFSAYGLRAAHWLRNLTGGALTGIALLCVLVLLLHQLGLLVFRGQVLFGAAAQWTLALRWAALYAVFAYVEAALALGYLQYTLTRSVAAVLRHFASTRLGIQKGFWISASLLSVGAAMLHRTAAAGSVTGLLSTLLFSLLLAFSLWRTGSLWWALGFHAAWHWSQSFLWGVPVSGVRARDHLFLTEATGAARWSGGSNGPEGSILAIGVLLAGFGILSLLHRRRVYPELWEEASRGLMHNSSAC